FDGSTLEEKVGGDIHIPWEGVCGADLFVYPAWRKIFPEEWDKDGAELGWATANKPCIHLLIEQDLGEPACATRIGPSPAVGGSTAARPRTSRAARTERLAMRWRCCAPCSLPDSQSRRTH